MKIIADTNIWYKLAKNTELFERVKNEPICPTFVNIYELSKTNNHQKNPGLVMKAIQMLCDFKQNTIFYPPYIYIAKLYHSFDYRLKSEEEALLKFTEQIANSKLKVEELPEGFFEKLDKKYHELKWFADYYNEKAEEIKQNVTNKNQFKKEDTTSDTGRFIDFIIRTLLGYRYSLFGFSMKKIRLLILTMDAFFKKLETSSMKMEANDWYDLAIMGYVQPEDKFWTEDKRWLRIIKEMSLEDYLYTP